MLIAKRFCLKTTEFSRAPLREGSNRRDMTAIREMTGMKQIDREGFLHPPPGSLFYIPRRQARSLAGR